MIQEDPDDPQGAPLECGAQRADSLRREGVEVHRGHGEEQAHHGLAALPEDALVEHRFSADVGGVDGQRGFGAWGPEEGVEDVLDVGEGVGEDGAAGDVQVQGEVGGGLRGDGAVGAVLQQEGDDGEAAGPAGGVQEGPAGGVGAVGVGGGGLDPLSEEDEDLGVGAVAHGEVDLVKDDIEFI